jgi:hypothetical protein
MMRATVCLLVLLAACAPARTQPDDFFTMPLEELEPVAAEAPVPTEGEGRGYHVQIRWTSGDQITQSPALLVHAGQWASVHVGNQISFVQDFDVEIEGDAYIADPIIGILQTGYAMTLRADPTDDGEDVLLSAELTRADLDKPIPMRNLRLRQDDQPVTIQLPTLKVGSAICAAHLRPGVESLLATFAGPDGPERIFATVDPVTVARSEKTPDFGGIEKFEPDATPLGTGSLRIRLLRTRGLDQVRYLDAGAAATLDAETIREFRLPGGAQPGTRVATLLQMSYVKGMTPKGAIRDPEIDNLLVGFEARIDRDGGTAVLRYEWSSLRGVRIEESGDQHSVDRRRGEIALRSDATLQPVARDADGRVLAILFERVES